MPTSFLCLISLRNANQDVKQSPKIKKYNQSKSERPHKHWTCVRSDGRWQFEKNYSCFCRQSDSVSSSTATFTSYTSDLFSCFQIELLTLLFLNSLAEEAKAKAFEERSATIRGHHVRAVSKVTSRLNEISRINVPLNIVAYRLPYIALELIQIKYCRLGFIKTKSSYMV